MLGSAGSGKSVQSEMISQRTGCGWISTGKLLRQSADPELQARLNSGELIDDKQVIEVLSEAIVSQEHGSTCILDGFPRTLNQAKWLIDWSAKNDCEIRAIIHLVVSPDVAIQRLSSRQRSDDTDAAIDVRLKEYDTIIQPILADFAQAGAAITEVSADGTIQDIDDEILRRLGI